MSAAFESSDNHARASANRGKGIQTGLRDPPPPPNNHSRVEIEGAGGHRFGSSAILTLLRSSSANARNDDSAFIFGRVTEAKVTGDLRVTFPINAASLKRYWRLASFAGRTDNRAFSGRPINSSERVRVPWQYYPWALPAMPMGEKI